MRILALFILTGILLTCTSFIFSLIDCSKVHTGKFYFYKNSDQYTSTIIRTDTVQIEINSKTKDTSIWKINWIDNCTFSTKYVSGLRINTQAEADFYRQSIIVFTIKELTDDYYTYSAEFKFNSLSNKYTDTLWRHSK